MRPISARQLATACSAVAMAIAALAVPAAANATVGPQCSGVAVEGVGATLTKTPQEKLWDPDFTSASDTNATACSGTQGSGGTPAVTYDPTSSGAGLESWGVSGHATSFATSNAFVDTDILPNAAIKSEIESHGAKTTLLTIPVLQAAIALPIHLPANCVATSTPAPGRLVLGNTVLQEIFRGTITKWSQITEAGDALSGAGCEPATTITRVVREEGAGPTAILMKYLFLTYKKKVLGKKTWDQLSEGANNTLWPNEGSAPLLKVAKNSGLATKVEDTASSIGYVDLADTRANGSFSPPTGGPGTATFWPEVQHGGGGKGKHKTPITYSDPSTDGDTGTKAQSNCESEVYTNGANKFPPPSVESTWNAVTTATTEPGYTLCGFAVALAFNSYHSYTGTSEAEATTVGNFLSFVLNDETGGGQALLTNSDFLSLPTSKNAGENVLKIAQEGAAKVSY
jgi:ABC-type phosphate transport system substrate-binding protein